MNLFVVVVVFHAQRCLGAVFSICGILVCDYDDVVVVAGITSSSSGGSGGGGAHGKRPWEPHLLWDLLRFALEFLGGSRSLFSFVNNNVDVWGR